MIIFYTNNFELDFSNKKITFVEENNIFYDYFLKPHSLPFSFYADDILLKKMGIITDYNAAPITLRYEGKLLKNDTFEDAYLIIKSINGRNIQGTLYYGKSNIPLLETPLSQLPFNKISVNNIAIHASDIVKQSWPETGYNFPTIIDKNFVGSVDYEDFRGFHNLYENGFFVQNSISYSAENQEFKPRNYNILTPCIYLMEILKTGFDSANIIMSGDLVNDQAFQKIMYHPDNHLEELDGDDVNRFKHDFSLGDFVPDMTFGSYLTKLKNWLNLNITFRKNIVTINYIEQHFKNIDFIDARHLEVPTPRITPSSNKSYKLTYSDSKHIYVERLGLVGNPNDFSTIKEIQMGISLLENGSHQGITTAEKKEDDVAFRIVLYNGLQSDRNVTIDNVFSRTFLLEEIYNRFWKRWLAFRLNSKTFRTTFKTTKDVLYVTDGIHNYNNNHIIKKMTKRKDNKNVYNITLETETIL